MRLTPVRNGLTAAFIGLSTVLSAKAQKTEPILLDTVETVAKSAQNKWSHDVGLRTFQFWGSNMTAASSGVAKNISNSTNLYASALAGINSAKQAWGGGFVSLENAYFRTPSNKFWLSQEAYAEATISAAKGSFDSKIAYAPIKPNFSFGNVTITSYPRGVFHFNKDGVTPKVETLTSVSYPIYKNFSGYTMFQTYDITKLKQNASVNVGVIYTLGK